jgi:hypothetical protein
MARFTAWVKQFYSTVKLTKTILNAEGQEKCKLREKENNK